jgi:hypothetical protein
LKKVEKLGLLLHYIEIGLLVLEGEMRQRYIIEKRVKKERKKESIKCVCLKLLVLRVVGENCPWFLGERRERENPQVLCKTGEPQCCNANKDAGFVVSSLIQIPTTQLSHYMELQITN